LAKKKTRTNSCQFDLIASKLKPDTKIKQEQTADNLNLIAVKLKPGNKKKRKLLTIQIYVLSNKSKMLKKLDNSNVVSLSFLRQH
jgi:hypothetical protein